MGWIVAWAGDGDIGGWCVFLFGGDGCSDGDIGGGFLSGGVLDAGGREGCVGGGALCGGLDSVEGSDGGLAVEGRALWEVAQMLESLEDICDMKGALGGFAFHAAQDEFSEGCGEGKIVASWIGRGIGEACGDDGEDVVALPCLLSRDHLKEDGSKSVDIGARVDLAVGGDLFGGHVSGRSDHAADNGLKVAGT